MYVWKCLHKPNVHAFIKFKVAGLIDDLLDVIEMGTAQLNNGASLRTSVSLKWPQGLYVHEWVMTDGLMGRVTICDNLYIN